ncbi:hypothetical protein GE061_019284 [Apolygus lucorum]|uniref:Dolichyl-diphosphooligosaccharide--protein glycosyltransferase subunit DAD1 n=1 Tax=Apolygus lucorum TaxID=248454 RepID=A0A8S9X815_APOLU|nr:hypothetical protein GE061_019284 [Apolygus lucorum]
MFGYCIQDHREIYEGDLQDNGRLADNGLSWTEGPSSGFRSGCDGVKTKEGDQNSKKTMTESSQKRKAKSHKMQPVLKSPSTLRTMFDKYKKITPVKLKIIDCYSLYAVATAVVQLVYVCIVGTFPFNAFLSGFISCVASVVAAVSLRSQVNPQNTYKFPNLTQEEAFAEFVFFHVVLHFAVVHFMG